MRGQYFSSGRLEHLANELLDIYERKKGATIEPPIEPDLVAERMGLDLLWEEISEGPGHTICAEIRPEKPHILYAGYIDLWVTAENTPHDVAVEVLVSS
ncbi:hypothetical protein BH23ACT11_BH23ACT11_04110 [soil metagenome]